MSSSLLSELVLEVKGLKTYFFLGSKVVRAVDGVSFHVRRSETLALVGESGCGKTVTALSILRLVPEPVGKIVEGEIWFHGRDLLRCTEKEMRSVRGVKISMIMQDPFASLNPVFTIGDQVSIPFKYHRKMNKEAIQEAVEHVLMQVGIVGSHRPREYPHQLSGGMRQRVVTAIAIGCEPDLLIADEPTTALDVSLQAQILDLLQELQNRIHMAIILITHDLGVVARMADRVAVMYAGKIIEAGRLERVFKEPLHPYTIGLLVSVPRLGGPRLGRLPTIEGQPPQLDSLPQGCSFWPRCREHMDICQREYPPYVWLDRENYVRCWARQRNGEPS